LIASTIERRISRPAMLAAGYLGPLLVIPVLLNPPVPVLFVCWYLFGVADALAVISMQAYLVESVTSDLRGRVYATWNGLITLAWLICYGVVGWITDHIGASWTIAIAGAIVGVGGPLILVLTNALDAVRSPRVVAVSTEGA
jgi:MFS family permease